MVEIKRRLSWVDFLAPLSEEQVDDLLLRADFVRLKEGEELVVGPEEQAERMVLLVAGQLQVYMMSPSERELTLSVLTSGSVVQRGGGVGRRSRGASRADGAPGRRAATGLYDVPLRARAHALGSHQRVGGSKRGRSWSSVP